MSELLALLMGHAVADFGLQSEWMAIHKSPKQSLDYAPWYYVMGSHGLIHGAAVWIVTGVWWLGALEAIAHTVIDIGKCQGLYGIHRDQALHGICKIAWWLL